MIGVAWRKLSDDRQREVLKYLGDIHRELVTDWSEEREQLAGDLDAAMDALADLLWEPKL